MKNTRNLLLASLLSFSVLAGCSDAQAKLKDSSTALFSVGKKTVTKGDLYSKMNSTSGASVVTNNATKQISAAEIEVTDDMKEKRIVPFAFLTNSTGDYLSAWYVCIKGKIVILYNQKTKEEIFVDHSFFEFIGSLK